MDGPVQDIMAYFATLRRQIPGSVPGGAVPQLPLLPDEYAYVADYRLGRVLHAQGFHRVLGHADDAVDLEFLFRCIHPDDVDTVTRIVERSLRTVYAQPVMQPFETVMSLTYRMRKADGTYIRILRKTTVYEADMQAGSVTSTLSICKDISHMKTSNQVGWQCAGPGTEHMDMSDILNGRGDLKYIPSPREIDVLRKLAEGKNSKCIAAELNISEHTVNNHRRNLLQRTGQRNSVELVRKMTELGWL